MGLLSFSSSPNKRARLSFTKHQSPGGFDWRDGHNPDHLTMRDGSAPPRFLEPLCLMGPTLTASLLASPPRKLPVTPAPPEPIRTVPGDELVGTPRRKMSLKRGSTPIQARPMSSHYHPSLPPGAAAPHFGSVLDQFVKDHDEDDAMIGTTTRPQTTLGRRASIHRKSAHIRSASASALESLGNGSRRAFGHQRVSVVLIPVFLSSLVSVSELESGKSE